MKIYIRTLTITQNSVTRMTLILDQGQGGVAIIWRKHLKVQRLSVGDDRVVAIKVLTKNENFVFCSVYLPSTNSSMSEFMNTVKCLEYVW